MQIRKMGQAYFGIPRAYLLAEITPKSPVGYIPMYVSGNITVMFNGPIGDSAIGVNPIRFITNCLIYKNGIYFIPLWILSLMRIKAFQMLRNME